METCDDEELEALRCSLRAAKALPPPQDGVEAFGDEPWFAACGGTRQALAEATELIHGSFKILVGDANGEIERVCGRSLRAGAVLRLGGAHGGFGEADVAYAYRQLSRALHPDKNPSNPLASEAFRRLKEAEEELKLTLEAQRQLLRRFSAVFIKKEENELQMKRPQLALLAEACRLLAAVNCLDGQGGVRVWDEFRRNTAKNQSKYNDFDRFHLISMRFQQISWTPNRLLDWSGPGHMPAAVQKRLEAYLSPLLAI